MSTESLKPKQEAFAQAYVESGNASEAYRRSYNAEKMTNETINVAACKLLANYKVAIRVKQLQEKAAKRHDITVDDLIRELEEARKLAIETEKAGPAVTATMGKAKLLGMDKQIIETTMRVVDDGTNEW